MARGILLADSISCAVAGIALAIPGPVATVVESAVESAVGTRWPIVGALAATSVLLGSGALEAAPSDRTLGRAALVNAGWVAACGVALTRRPGRAAAAVFTATAVADGAAAAVQWALRDGHPARR